jgi:hypothetical protein
MQCGAKNFSPLHMNTGMLINLARAKDCLLAQDYMPHYSGDLPIIEHSEFWQ